MKKIYTRGWYEHSWVAGKWAVDIDLPMVGVGAAYCAANGSCFLCLPFIIVSRGA